MSISARSGDADLPAGYGVGLAVAVLVVALLCRLLARRGRTRPVRVGLAGGVLVGGVFVVYLVDGALAGSGHGFLQHVPAAVTITAQLLGLLALAAGFVLSGRRPARGADDEPDPQEACGSRHD